MRVLVISRSAWRNDNSTGNTLTDFFSSMPCVDFYSLCMREQPPQNDIAKRNFYISEKQLIRNLIHRECPVGAENDANSNDDGFEEKVYTNVKKHPNYPAYFMREALWSIGRWKNENFRKYIEEVNPDLIFCPVFGCYYPHKLLQYIHKLTDAPIVLFHADDHYTLKQFQFSPLYWIYRFGLRKWVRRSVRISALNYCISTVQKEDYDKAFGCDCKILTKFADFSGVAPLKEVYSHPAQIIFTGNMNLNRWKSLAMLARVLKKINEPAIKAQLRIYSPTFLTKAMKKALDLEGTSYLMGSVPFEQVSEIQKNADFLVHAEAMDLKNRLLVRQSFSTKIVDYFKAARPIIAIGSSHTASIKHLMDHHCAIVAQNEQELFSKLNAVIDREEEMHCLAKTAYDCGKSFHNKEMMLKMLQSDFEEIVRMHNDNL